MGREGGPTPGGGDPGCCWGQLPPLGGGPVSPQPVSDRRRSPPDPWLPAKEALGHLDIRLLGLQALARVPGPPNPTTDPRPTPGPAGGRLRPQGPCREFWEMCFPKSQEKAVEKQRTGSHRPVAGPAVRPRPSHVPPRWAAGPTCEGASCPQELRPSLVFLCLRQALESQFPRRCYPGPGGAAFLAPRQVSGPQADPLSPRVPVASMQGA